MNTPNNDRRRDVPVSLSAGTHLFPSEGACLMEAVSVAAKLPWSDSPSCTHPLVAHLARLVNDTMSEDGRQQLVALVPRLMATGDHDPDVSALVTAQVAVECTERALGIRTNLLLVHLHHAAVAQLRREERPGEQDSLRHRGPVWSSGPARALGRRVRRRLFARGAAARGVEAAVVACLDLEGAARDRALLDMLRAALTVTPSRGRSALERAV